MTTSNVSRSGSNVLVWLVLLLIALGASVAARAVFLNAPFENDAGVYAAMGKSLFEGKPLYQHVFEIKPPAVAVLFAGLWAWLGNDWPAWVAVQCVVGVLTPLLIADVVRRHVDRAKFLPTFIIGLLALNCARITLTGFQLETLITFMTALTAWTAAINLNRRSLWLALVVGLLGGVAGSIKPTALSVLGAYGLTVLLCDGGSVGRRVSLCWAAFVGFFVVLAANFAVVNGLSLWPVIGDVFREIGLYGSGTPWSQIMSPKTLVILGLIGWPALVVLVWPGDRVRLRVSSLLVFALLWALAETAGVILQKRGYAYHFLVIVPPAVLLAGVWGVKRSLAATLVAGLPLLGASMHYARHIYRQADFNHEVVEYLKGNTSPGDAIFSEPLGEMMVRTDREPGARLLMLINLINYDSAARVWGDRVLADLAERKPKYIVLQNPTMLEERITNWEKQPVLGESPQRMQAHRDAWRRLVEFTRANYELETHVAGRDIYRLRR
jgi:hypothetical protein